MNPILLRYVGITFVAVIGIVGGYMFVNNKSITPSGIISAIPAEPFPGAGIPAVPATPAQKPLTENTIVVERPAGNRGYVRGLSGAIVNSGLPIVWSWNLPKGTKTFDVNLLKGGQFFRKIDTIKPQYGWPQRPYVDATFYWFEWDIPADVPTGSDYVVEVILVSGGKNREIKGISPQFSILDENITVNGRLADRYTKEAIANANVQPGYFISGDPQLGFSYSGARTVSDTEGVFTFTTNVNTHGSITYEYTGQCYMRGLIRPFLSYGFNSLDLLSMTFRVVGDYTETPILNNIIERNVEMWPAAHLQVISDIPVKVSVDYSGYPASSFGSIGWYNFNTLSKSHRIENIFPLDYKNGVEVVLIDGAGNKYYSPEYRIGRDRKCDTVTLNFANREFEWE